MILETRIPTMSTTTSTYLSYPTLEAAVSHLGEKVFGASIVIQPTAPTVPTAPTYRLLEEGEEILITDEWEHPKDSWRPRDTVSRGERLDLDTHTPHRRLVTAAAPSPTPSSPVGSLRGMTCPRCLWSNGDLINYGVTGQPDWMCHGCATQENQRLGRIDTALLKLRGLKAITSPDAAVALGQAGAVIADKDAVIRRLKVKLEALEEETKRLHAKWHAAEELANGLKDGWDRHQKDLFAYGKFTTDLAKALGWSTHEINHTEVTEEVKWLVRWKKGAMEAFAKWEEVDAYVRGHKDAPLGAHVSEVTLQRLKERDDFKDAWGHLTKALDKTTPA